MSAPTTSYKKYFGLLAEIPESTEKQGMDNIGPVSSLLAPARDDPGRVLRQLAARHESLAIIFWEAFGNLTSWREETDSRLRAIEQRLQDLQRLRTE